MRLDVLELIAIGAAFTSFTSLQSLGAGSVRGPKGASGDTLLIGASTTRTTIAILLWCFLCCLDAKQMILSIKQTPEPHYLSRVDSYSLLTRLLVKSHFLKLLAWFRIRAPIAGHLSFIRSDINPLGWAWICQVASPHFVQLQYAVYVSHAQNTNHNYSSKQINYISSHTNPSDNNPLSIWLCYTSTKSKQLQRWTPSARYPKQPPLSLTKRDPSTPFSPHPPSNTWHPSLLLQTNHRLLTTESTSKEDRTWALLK